MGRDERPADVPIPPTISALLAARLDKLPAERRLLDIASVMGQIFYPGAMRALSDDGGDIGPGISALVRRQFIHPERSDLAETDAMAFRHLLIRDAAYDAVPKTAEPSCTSGSRRGWTRRVGRSGNRTRSSATTSNVRTATGSNSAPRAIANGSSRTRQVVAWRTRVRRRFPAAIITHRSVCSRASALLVSEDPLRLNFLPDLGASLFWAGDADGSRATLAEATERTAAAGDDRMNMHASIQRWLFFGDDDDDAAAIGEAERALRVFGAVEDERGLSRAWRLMAAHRSDDIIYDDEALEEALLHARNAGDVGEQAETYWQVGFNLARGHAHRGGDPAMQGHPGADRGEPDALGGDVPRPRAPVGSPRSVRRGAGVRCSMSRHQSGERRPVGLLGARRDPLGHQDAGRRA